MDAKVSVLSVSVCAVLSLGGCSASGGPTSVPSAAAQVNITLSSPAAPTTLSPTPTPPPTTGSPPTAAATTIAVITTVAATPQRVPQDRPPAVITVTAGPGGGSGEVALRWSAVKDADGYKILRSASTSGTYEQTVKLNVVTGVTSASAGVVNLWSPKHSYVPASTMSGRDTSTNFEYVEVRGVGPRCFKVVAFNTAGDSAPSKVVCGSPPS